MHFIFSHIHFFQFPALCFQWPSSACPGHFCYQALYYSFCVFAWGTWWYKRPRLFYFSLAEMLSLHMCILTCYCLRIILLVTNFAITNWCKNGEKFDFSKIVWFLLVAVSIYGLKYFIYCLFGHFVIFMSYMYCTFVNYRKFSVIWDTLILQLLWVKDRPHLVEILKKQRNSCPYLVK